MSTPVLSPSDKRKQKNHANEAWKSYKRVFKAITPLYNQAIQGKKAKSVFVKSLENSSQVNEFLSAYIGDVDSYVKAFNWRKTVLVIFRDHHFGNLTEAQAKKKLTKVASRSYPFLILSESQANLATIPPEIRAFLPFNMVIETDKNNKIKKFTEKFGNKKDTIVNKVESIRNVIQQYNHIVKQVKKDLKSTNDRTRFKALVTSILMETGIRPGREGTSSTVADVEVDTFGAVTLQPSHINFVKQNFAEISFVGKGGKKNTASLRNRQVISILKSYAKKSLNNNLSHIFIDNAGVPLSRVEIVYYFEEHFGSVRPKDLRRYKATEVLFESIKQEQVALKKKIVDFANQQVSDLKERVVKEVVEVLNRALERAQDALSHSTSTETLYYYVSPELVLNFLSQGYVEDNLKTAILKNQRTFEPFDIDVFVQRVISKKASKDSLLSIYSELTRLFD